MSSLCRNLTIAAACRLLLGLVYPCPAQPLEGSTIHVRVTTRETARKPVTRLLYGNFIESGFGRQVDGMWAEMLFNRSFEIVPPLRGGWLARRAGQDLTKEPWWHSGYEENPWRLTPGNVKAELRFRRFSGFHHGEQGAEVANPSAAEVLLVQDGIYLRAGMKYRFRGFLKPGAKTAGPVSAGVALYSENEFSRPLTRSDHRLSASGWTEITAELHNAEHQGRASFAIVVPAGATLHIDNLSLMPADNMDGWRRDVVEGLRRVRPSIIRFPGGCYASFAHWRDGVGPRDERRPRESAYWGGLEYNDVGTDEFIRLCRLIGAQPLLVVNMMTGRAEEVADWVAYCNAPAAHPMGAKRAANGHPEPYRVRYWELDNETGRKWSAEEYARKCVEFSRAMKAVDPSIQLVAVGYQPFSHALAEILEIAGRDIDLVSDRAKGEAHLRNQMRILREYSARTGRDLRLCNTEWLAPWVAVPPDSTLGGGGLLNRQNPGMTIQQMQIRWRYAMNAARTLMMFRRFGGDFEFANFNNMANTWGQNVIECPKEPAFLSAAGRVFELYSGSPAAWPLELETAQREDVEAQVSWDLERKRLVLDMLNYRGTAVDFRFDLSQLPLTARNAAVRTLWAESLMAYNSTAHREAVRTREQELRLTSPKECRLTVPAYSVTQVLLD